MLGSEYYLWAHHTLYASGHATTKFPKSLNTLGKPRESASASSITAFCSDSTFVLTSVVSVSLDVQLFTLPLLTPIGVATVNGNRDSDLAEFFRRMSFLVATRNSPRFLGLGIGTEQQQLRIAAQKLTSDDFSPREEAVPRKLVESIFNRPLN